MKKSLFLIGLMSLSVTALASMEVESFGLDGLEVKTGGKFIHINNRERKNQAEKLLFLDAVNKDKIASLMSVDFDLEGKIIPYVDYIGINNIKNYGGGIGFLKRIDENYLVGIDGEMYQTSYNRSHGYKGLVNLHLGYQEEDDVFVLTPFFYLLKNSEKINEKNIGVTGYFGQAIETELLENLSYEIDALGMKKLKSKKEKDNIFRAGIALKHTDDIELDSLNVKIKEKLLYQYKFKDEAKLDSPKDKVGVAIGAEITKNSLTFSLENEFKKSLSTKNYENSTTFSISYKF